MADRYLMEISVDPREERLGAAQADEDTLENPASPQEWLGFLQREVAATKHVFHTKPKLLLSQVRGERQVAHDYAGRELLELIQNAADAAAEVGGNGRIRIEITRRGLVVANTGRPFRSSGVESLMTAHASDKPNRKIKLIGAKGLGFRSLLNWSHEPIVSSGALEICFSKDHATSEVRALASANQSIARMYDEEDEPPVPVLAFPAFGAHLERLEGIAASLLDHARSVRLLGYDTVVAAPFDNERAFERATRQAGEFDATFLLFVEALVEIEIHIDGQLPVTWSRTFLGADTYRLTARVGGQESKQEWICSRKRGQLAGTSKRKAASYELAISFRTDEPAVPSHLHSYFPTSIALPLPALFHATLELDSNRKSLNENSDLNDAVLEELAAFYADALWRLVKTKRIANGLDFLARNGEFPEPLRRFEEHVYSVARTLEIIPTLRGHRRRADAVRTGPRGYETYLPTRLFGDLAKCRTPGDRAVLSRLGVKELPPASIVRTLRKSELSLDERARAVAGIAETLEVEHHDRSLLLDQAGRPMATRNTPFPPPAGGDELPKLPDWAKAKFIQPELWRLLLRKVQGDTRDKIKKLSGFGITEYSIESVIISLRQQAMQAMKSRRRDPVEVQRSLLKTVRAFYSADNRSPPGTFKVACGDGIWREAREVHLSSEYGLAGRINEALYVNAPGMLLGSAVENGLASEGESLGSFFEWIGVNRWPRAVNAPVMESLRSNVLRALPDEITVTEGASLQTFAKSEIVWKYNFEAESSMVVGLDRILAEAESDAILAWLAYDPRFDRTASYPFSTTARGRKDGKAIFRQYKGPLPDLVRELITQTRWLDCRDDHPHAPSEVMVQPVRLGELFSIPRAAAVGSDLKFGLSQAMWRRGLENAGIPQSLADLTEARIFRLLKDLQNSAVTDDVVRRFYQQVLELEMFDVTAAAAERRDFLANGMLLVRQGHNRDWVAPDKALYADQTGFPAAGREYLSLIELPPRRNTGNVEERFGVKALSQQQYAMRVVSVVEEVGPFAASLRADLSQTLPYIRALRMADGSAPARIRRLDKLELKVVRSAEIAVAIGERNIDGTLEPWTHILDENTLIVAIENSLSPSQLVTLAHEAIADGIAELFDLQSGTDFAKLLTAQGDALRRILLRRMLPNLSDEEIASLFSELPAPEDQYEPVQIDQATLARGPAPTPPPPADGPTTQPESGPAAGTPSNTTPTRPLNPGSLASTPVPTGPPQPFIPRPGRRIAVRVARATGPLSPSSPPDPHRAADAEEWTGLFEINHGRFPLLVAHLQGQGAYGCDWLSFASETDRATFLLDPKRLDLVARFIETKSGSIELTDTESRAAERHGNRYFVYRILFYSGMRDFAELTLASNPLIYREALSARYEFHIDAVEGRQRYDLIPDPDDP